MTDKPTFDQVDVGAHRGSDEKYEHGDRALSVIGHGRVVVTAEEVRDQFVDSLVTSALALRVSV